MLAASVNFTYDLIEHLLKSATCDKKMLCLKRRLVIGWRKEVV